VHAEESAELVGDRLLDVRDDLVAVRIALQAAARRVEVGAQSVVCALLELVRVAVQVDDDYFVHWGRPCGYCPCLCPRFFTVALIVCQYSKVSLSCSRPLAVGSWYFLGGPA